MISKKQNNWIKNKFNSVDSLWLFNLLEKKSMNNVKEKSAASWLKEPNNVKVMGIDSSKNKYSFPLEIVFNVNQHANIQNIKLPRRPA